MFLAREKLRIARLFDTAATTGGCAAGQDASREHERWVAIKRVDARSPSVSMERMIREKNVNAYLAALPVWRAGQHSDADEGVEANKKECVHEERGAHNFRHPLLVRLRHTFKDAAKGLLFFAFDLVPGGSLAKHLALGRPGPALGACNSASRRENGSEQSQKRGSGSGSGSGGAFSAVRARFYVAQLISFVEHLHAHGIVHRDINPKVRCAPQGWEAYC